LRDFCRWIDEIQRSGFADSGGEVKIPPFVIFESAIILEKPPIRAIADKVMTVSAPVELRLKRIMERDKVNEIEAHKRLEIQWSDAKRELLSDFIIRNDGVTPLLPQIETVLSEMRIG
jgi:dephospho-CoA kinase